LTSFTHSTIFKGIKIFPIIRLVMCWLFCAFARVAHCKADYWDWGFGGQPPLKHNYNASFGVVFLSVLARQKNKRVEYPLFFLPLCVSLKTMTKLARGGNGWGKLPPVRLPCAGRVAI
jgi:hypothetical protein